MTKNLLWSTCVYIHRLSCLLLLPPAQWNVTWWKDDERSMSIMETWWNMSVNPDQVSDLLMVTRRLWPQQLAQRKQSWHLDYQFLRMIECCNVLRCVLYMESVSACVYTCTNIYEYGCSANASGAWNGGNFGGRSHQTFHGGRTWGALTGMMGRWEDGKMGTDVFLQASLMGFIALPVWLMMLGFAVDLLSFDTFHYLSLCGGLFLSPLAAHKSLQWISDAFWGLETCPVEVGFWLDLKVLVIVLVPNNMCMQFTFHVSVALH